jgi:hypothetical protein
MQRGLSSLAISLAFLAIAAEFTISASLLTVAGSDYVSDGGWLPEKLHPGSYLAASALAAHAAASGRPLRDGWDFIWRKRDIAAFLGGIGFCLLYAAIMTGTGNLIVLLDTFLPAGMLAVVLADMTQAQRALLRRMALLCLVVNAGLAFAEAAAGAHLIPIDPAIPERPEDFGPTALYDHPLTGAASTMTGLFLMPAGSRPWRVVYGVWMFAALVAFGGRVALALTIIIMAGACLAGIVHQIGQRHLFIRPASFVAAMSVTCAAAVTLVLGSGLATRLQTHFYWDPSAQARLDQFRIFAGMDMTQILFGCPRAELLAQIEPLRLAYGVDVLENFWLLMAATLGLLCFPVFVLAVLGLARFLWRRSGTPVHCMIISMLLAASASNSLGRKSTLLVILVACVMASDVRGLPVVRPGRSALRLAKA